MTCKEEGVKSLFAPGQKTPYLASVPINEKYRTMEKVALGIDIGGTNTKYGFVDAQGNIYCEASVPTLMKNQDGEQESFEQYIDRLCAEVLRAKADCGHDLELIGAGIGAPDGNVFSGAIEFAVNLPWKGVLRAAALVEQRLGVPTRLTNDANAAAMGEMLFGTARGLKDFIVITLGTGVGSGIVIGGKVVYGHDGFAGELGHVIVKDGGRVCGCGRRGCLETYCSAGGVRRTVMELLGEETVPSVLRDISYEDMTAARIYEAAMEGDVLAREAFRRTAGILGRALANFVAFSSPKTIILFGGVARSGELLRRPVEEAMEESMLHCFKNKVKVVLSDLSEGNVAILGSAALAWDAFREQGNQLV